MFGKSARLNLGMAAKDRNNISADIRALLDLIRNLKACCPNKDTVIFHIQKLLNK